MAAEDRESVEARGAGESGPAFPKVVPDDPMSEGKSRPSLEAESPKPDSSYHYLEEMEAREDTGCPGPPKSLCSKAGPTAKGQAGDAPELEEPPPAPATPGTPGTERNAEMELEKVRMEFELTRLKYLHEENERQRQHEEVMEQLQQQAMPRLFEKLTLVDELKPWVYSPICCLSSAQKIDRGKCCEKSKRFHKCMSGCQYHNYHPSAF
ncbi:transmembrane protein 247 isoform X2 [Neofelis nebulosa]|uniref:transmembrane protein 247 isoform X2 n=1 Tax=Neofelis nebulosa TaxID=61452 RepID=UPI00272C1E5F|nr:transmembrane protein 247 isoform X2 [Neofelis nebulosa]